MAHSGNPEANRDQKISGAPSSGADMPTLDSPTELEAPKTAPSAGPKQTPSAPDGSGTFKGATLNRTSTSLLATEDAPSFIGPYRLVKLLGEGGTGRVWLAEQTVPFRRTVVLKLINGCRYDQSVIQRSESERKPLAIVAHPAITRVLDAGTTPDGEPFLVMEFVPGSGFTDYGNQMLDALALTGEQLELSVVLPCLNEEETVGICVRKAIATLQKEGISGEVIVADNGSTDGSVETARAEGARVVNVVEKGYGNAVKGGVLAACGQYVLMADSDDSYDFSHIARFVKELRAGSDLVMGNRFSGGIAREAMPFLHRYLGNPVLTGIGRLFFGSTCKDFHCGMRAFRKDSFRRMDIRSTGMEFASEMVVKASLLQMKVSEVPTTLAPDGRSHSTHLRTWRDGWRHLRFLLMYSPRWLFLYPGILMILLGLVGCVLLLPGPRVFRGIGFDLHTLLYAFVSVLVGFQLVAFATFTKVFAITEGLMPEDPRLNRLFRWVTLETGLVIGGLLMALGIGGSVWAVSHWARDSFGALEPGQMLRVVMPSVFFLTLGVEITFSSFFLSILGLRRR